MKYKTFLILSLVILATFISAVCLGAGGTYPIRHNTVQPARQLVRLLQDRIGTLDDEVTALEAASTGGLFDNLGTGDVFYVDSAAAADGAGTTWATAVDTLDEAFALCTDGNHDVIYVASGHAEDIATVAMDKSDVTIIGIGSGTDMPELTWDTTTDEINVSAQGITMYNIRFIAEKAEIVNAIEVTATGDYFSLIGCEFAEPATNTWEFLKAIQLTTAGNNVTIAYNTYVNIGANAGATHFIDGGAGVVANTTIIGNNVNADMSGAIIFSDQADTNLIIANNTFTNEDEDKLCIQLTSTATGIIANNLMCNLGGRSYILDPGSCFCHENYAGTAVDTTALLIPAVHGDDELAEYGTGTIFYCDSGSSGTGGRSWADAVATVDAAIALCTADAGDVIYVAQDHSEVEAGAASIFTLDVAGVSIIGCGNGSTHSAIAAGAATYSQMPTFILDHASATATISKDNCKISGLLFESDVADNAVGLTLAATADGCVVENCVFRDGAAAEEMVVAISVGDDCDAVKILNNTFSTYPSGGCDNAILLAGVSDDSIISGNIAYGTYAAGTFLATAKASRNLTITHNTFVNLSEIAIDLNASTTGILSFNCLGGGTSIAAALTDEDLMWCFENYVSGEDAKSGLLDPTADGD